MTEKDLVEKLLDAALPVESRLDAGARLLATDPGAAREPLIRAASGSSGDPAYLEGVGRLLARCASMTVPLTEWDFRDMADIAHDVYWDSLDDSADRYQERPPGISDPEQREMTGVRVTALSESLQPMVGLVVARARIRAGSFLLLDLGGMPSSPAVSPIDPMVWVYMAAWQLTCEGQAVAASEDDRAKMQGACDRLVGERISSIVPDGPAMDLRIHFDNHLLQTFAIHSSRSDEGGEEIEWAVWLPSKEVVYATPNGVAVEDAQLSVLTKQRANMGQH